MRICVVTSRNSRRIALLDRWERDERENEATSATRSSISAERKRVSCVFLTVHLSTGARYFLFLTRTVHYSPLFHRKINSGFRCVLISISKIVTFRRIRQFDVRFSYITYKISRADSRRLFLFDIIRKWNVTVEFEQTQRFS